MSVIQPLSKYKLFTLDQAEQIQDSLSSLTGRDNVDSLRFDPVIDLAHKAMADLWRIVDFAVLELERQSSSLANPLVVEQLAEALVTGLLYAQPHNYSHLLTHRVYGNEPKYVRLIEEFN